jgi:hypothetical protein
VVLPQIESQADETLDSDDLEEIDASLTKRKAVHTILECAAIANKKCHVAVSPFWNLLDNMKKVVRGSVPRNVYPTAIPADQVGHFAVARRFGERHPNRWIKRSVLREQLGTGWKDAHKQTGLVPHSSWKALLPLETPTNNTLYMANINKIWYFIYWNTNNNFVNVLESVWSNDLDS